MGNQENQARLPFQLKTLLVLFCLLIVWQAASILLLPKGSLSASDLTSENILRAVSAERTLRNLNALNSDTRLSSAAQYKAGDMISRRYFSHTDPEGNYIWGKIVEAGYTPYLQLGENLAIEFYNTESLVSAWMNSPTHRANILNEGFKDQGAGLAFGKPEQGQYYSSIANTFGALLAAKKESAALGKTEPSQPLPAPKTTAPEAIALSEPIIPKANDNPKKTQDQKPPSEPLRDGSAITDKTQIVQNFALPKKQPQSPAPEAAAPTDAAVMPNLAPAQNLTPYEINRYLMMGLAAVLILMLVSDLKRIFEQKLGGFDKKINNLVLLILSLIIIGLMYWL